MIDNEKGQNKKKTSKKLIAVFIILGFLIVIAGALVGTFIAMRTIGKRSMENRRQEATVAFDEAYDNETGLSFEDGRIKYNGSVYEFNNEVSTFLFVGVDSPELSHEDGAVADSGLADTILIAVLNEAEKSLRIIPVDRNSITEIEIYNSFGESVGTSMAQIAYAYAYGDGKELSCDHTADVVSEFLYGIPVHAYFAMPWSVISDVNDSVGGVTVELTEDMPLYNGKKTIEYKKGDTVRLRGALAESYLKARQGVGDGSNAGRMSRQKNYLSLLIEKAKSAFFKDVTLVVDIYKIIKDKTCTDLTESEMIYLATLLTDLNIEFLSIPGRTETDGEYDKFYADGERLLELVLDVFYLPISS